MKLTFFLDFLSHKSSFKDFKGEKFTLITTMNILPNFIRKNNKEQIQRKLSHFIETK